ncbi:unnamed protein product [Caenorhabditis auriculariae]|uniref:Uncharacterized protein n=1 Tax=Caenorhabditis auriculariae TaxID=2777116 RepID=A0A8S1GQ01_9PELO|nr:unnamed protein product [Caenorhabditis auriculariae]
MCAVALNFSQSHLTAKAFPVHYFENALQFLLSNGGKYSSVIRCAFNASRVLSKLGLKKEAAMMLSKLSALDGDQLVAIAQSEAAQKFENSGMKRKAAFYRVLAGNRFANAAIPPLAFDSYRLAFPTLGEDHWGVIEEHLSVKLLTEGSKTNGKLKAPMAFECVRRLVRVCPQLGEQQQHQRLALLVQILTNFTAENESARLDLPTVESKNISVICGERPLWDDTAKEEGEVGHDEWISIERAAHHALYGSSAPFRGMQLVSNAYTDNQKIRETPIGERFRVRFELRNPLSVRLTLRNVRLSVADVHAKDVPVDQCLQAEHVELVQIEPLEKVTLELVVRPLEGCTKFKVDGILGRLEIDENLGIHIKVPVEIKGKRLNKTPKQQKSVVYAADERLHATVSTRSWPLLDIRTLKGAPSFAYCDQAVRYVFEMENIGAETVSAMTVATNGFDCVSAGWMDENSTRIPISRSFAANSSSIVVFNFTSPEGVPLIRVGEKKRMFIDVRMAATETSSTAFDSAETRRGPTAMLVAYRGEFGSMREWRRVVDVRRKRLLNVRSTLLDESKGLFSLSFRNCVATNEAALSRVEILRIRAASSDPATSRNAVKLAMMTSRKVEIESEQSDVICLSMTSAEDEAQNELWLSKNVDFPAWPCPIPAQNDETACKRQIGVFWKASVVDNEGHVSSLLGESFVDDPFEKADSVHPGEEESKKEANILISCDVEKLVSHDFKSQRMCEVPMQVKIKNVDAKGRDAKINVKFVSKVREPISGVHLLPPETRQQLWIDRPERKLTLRGHEEKSFRLKVRMAQASVYDVGGAQLQIEALFEGEDPAAVHKFKVPNLLSVVKAV